MNSAVLWVGVFHIIRFCKLGTIRSICSLRLLSPWLKWQKMFCNGALSSVYLDQCFLTEYKKNRFTYAEFKELTTVQNFVLLLPLKCNFVFQAWTSKHTMVKVHNLCSLNVLCTIRLSMTHWKHLNPEWWFTTVVNYCFWICGGQGRSSKTGTKREQTDDS